MGELASIASLTSSCNDLRGFLEAERDWLCDTRLASAKVLQTRDLLDQVGDTILDRRPWKPRTLADGQDMEVRRLADVLSSLDDILRRTDDLCKRYSCSSAEAPATAYGGHTSQERIVTADQLESPPTAARKPRSSLALPTLGRRLCWALRDRKKFERVLADFDPVLSNLERIAAREAKEHPAPSATPQRTQGMVCQPPGASQAASCHDDHWRDTRPRAVPRVSQGALSANSGNRTTGQSLLIIGEAETDAMRLAIAQSASFSNNETSDRSIACLTPMRGDAIKELIRDWSSSAEAEAVSKGGK